MRRIARVLLRVVPAAAAVLLLVGPAGSTLSVGPSVSPLPLSGPFPTHQWVSVWVPSVDVTRDPGLFEEGLLEVQMSFGLDTRPCPLFEFDEVTVFPALAARPHDWPDDCGNTYRRRRDFNVDDSRVRVAVDVRLPSGEVSRDGPVGEPYPMLRVFRYSDQVRVHIQAIEWDPMWDDFMGGALAKFGPRSHFGLGMGRDPLVAGDAEYSFDTCRDSGSCFATTFHLRVVPERKQQGRNLEVYEVVGPDNCVGGEPFTWGVSLRNMGRVASEQYIAVIGQLDAEGRLVHEWHSANQTTPIGPFPFGAAAGLAVPAVRLGPGEHRLAVYARSIETDPYHATAVETTIRCRGSRGAGEDLSPGQIPTATSQLRQPGLEILRTTATPLLRIHEVEPVTSTPYLSRPERETSLFSPTPTPRLRFPEIERALPTATPTPVLRGPGTTIRAPEATPTPDASDVRAPFSR